MRVAVRSVAWVLVFVALGAAAMAWFTPEPELEPADARASAVGAFEEIGLDGTVSDPVERSQHEPSEGDPMDVWVVFVEVGDDRIETRVREDAGQLVYVDDRIGENRQDRLLTDEQFDTIADYRNEDHRSDWVRRNAFAMVAAALIAVIGFVIAKRSDDLWTGSPDGRDPLSDEAS